MSDKTYPNVLLIVLDTVRADRFDGVNNSSDITPFLQKFAKDSLVYNNCYAAANWSVPSHASLFTGLYPSSHHVSYRSLKLSTDFPTIAEIMSAAGFHTQAITANAWISEVTNLDRGFEHYHAVWPSPRKSMFEKLKHGCHLLVQYLTNSRDKGGKYCAEVFERFLSNRAKSKPFFAFINLMEAHAPYNAPIKNNPSLLVKYLKQLLNPYLGLDYTINNELLNNEDLHHISQWYNHGVKTVDKLAEKVVATLKDYGLYNETLIIITSDHGENLGEEGFLGHQFNLSDNLIRVPLIIKLPHQQYAGSSYDDPVQLVDVVPTILDVCSLTTVYTDQNFDGFSILPANLPIRERLFLVAEDIGPEIGVLRRRYGEELARIWDVDQCRLLTADQSYIIRSNNSLTDISAKFSISDDLTSQMESYAVNWLVGCKKVTTPLHSLSLEEGGASNEIIDRLRSLGYLD